MDISEIDVARFFHGHFGPFLALGVKMGELALKELGCGKFGLKGVLRLKKSTPYSCIVDGVQIKTGCTWGRGTLQVLETNNPADVTGMFWFSGKKIEIKVRRRVIEEMIKGLSEDNMEERALDIYHGKPRELFEYTLNKQETLKPLPMSFYTRDPAVVARDLLGNLLVRKLKGKLLYGKIVETEAYYGKGDPASRAHTGKPKFCVKLMEGEPGRALIYMVHGNWLFNVTAHPPGQVGGVLIRAIEPLEGIEIMKENRGSDNIKDIAAGPGKLTRALAVTKELNGVNVTRSGEVYIAEGKEGKLEIGEGHRIGVSKDLERPLRFFIKGNPFVSKKS